MKKMNNYENLKKEFYELLNTNISRDGISSLLEYLEKSDFFEAPASTKYHGAYKGGLLEHSINVYYSLIDTLQFYFGKDWEQRYSKETATIVSLFHDLCKIGRYKTELKNVKNMETGRWEEKFVYVYDKDYHNMGHGAKSVMIILDHMYLTEIEKEAIFWHMGAFDLGNYNTVGDLGETYSRNTLAYALHRADMDATYIIENPNFEPIPLETTNTLEEFSNGLIN
jgi:hypothetical protein